MDMPAHCTKAGIQHHNYLQMHRPADVPACPFSQSAFQSLLPLATERTCECPCLTSTHSYSFPGMDSQIHTLLSRPHVAMSEPSGLHDTHFTSFSWPSSVATWVKATQQSTYMTPTALF